MRELKCEHFTMKTPHLELPVKLQDGERVWVLFCVKCLKSLEPYEDICNTASTGDIKISLDKIMANSTI